MEVIYEDAFPQVIYTYGERFGIIEHFDGEQNFVFYSIDGGAGKHAIGLFEVLINDDLSASEQLIIDYGELSVPASDVNDNYGTINIKGGSNYLLTLFDKFTWIKGYTMCNYKQQLSAIGSIECQNLPEGQYSLDPFIRGDKSCSDSPTTSDEKAKLEFVC